MGLRAPEQISDTYRMAWLSARIDYLEHSNADGVQTKQGCYWPQNIDDIGGAQVPELCGLTLTEYIDAMIRREIKERQK